MHTRQRKASSTSDCRPTAPPYLQAAFCGRRPVLRLVISRDTPSALQSLLHTASSAPNDPARPRCCHQQPLCLALRRSDLSASCQPFFYKVRVEIGQCILPRTLRDALKAAALQRSSEGSWEKGQASAVGQEARDVGSRPGVGTERQRRPPDDHTLMRRLLPR
ncbi:unnamed protein product [Gadus morhua 'NCC']